MKRDKFICVETGEVVDLHELKKGKKQVVSFSKAVGVDVKFPYECITTDSLHSTLDVMDAYYKNKPKINFEYLLDSVTSGYITRSELSLLRVVADNLSGWDIYIGSLKQLGTCGITPTNLAKAVKVSKNLRVLSRDKPFKGDIVLEVNPLVAWKGDTEYQQSRIKTWYSTNS